MILLLLLTSMLLSGYFHLGRVVNAQRLFMIGDVTLSIEPSTEVTRDTNVTLRCRATVSISGPEPLSCEYTIYKDSSTVYTKISSTSEDLLYPLPQARVSNTGKYKCAINIDGKQSTSQAKKLTVTGLSKPVLHLNKEMVSEGEELTARCTAPGETGFIIFYFYEGSNEILDMQVNSNQAEAKLHFSSVGIHKIHCVYIVLVTPNTFRSEDSNNVIVSVKELPITPLLEIEPQSTIYEGDLLAITCTMSNFPHSSQSAHLYLSQGTQLLSSGDTKVNHSMIALAKDPGEFECKLEMGNVLKVATKSVSVTELFSVPTLTMSPAEVFQKEYMTLTCKSENYASERLSKNELTYTLGPPQHLLNPKENGVFFGKALQFEFNYTCAAHAKGIVKHSKTLTVQPKVSVSVPKISVVDRAVLGRPVKIQCKSDAGSLPINYTLLKDYDPVSTTSVELPLQQAVFTVFISRTDELRSYMCEAKNSPKDGPLSSRLSSTVIEPLSNPTLTVIPNITEISEGDHLYLICGIKGTPPVTFKWYRSDQKQPLYTTTSNYNNTNFQIPLLSKDHSGKYHCEADNHANNIVRSDSVNIEVRMALWKKAVIAGFCLLAMSVVVVVVCVLCFRFKRGKREAAAELSVKPSSPKSDDTLTVNLTHDTEVYKTATVRVDSAAVSVWTKGPPEDDTVHDDESSEVTNEPDVEYTEVVHPRPVDPTRVPFRKGTDTVYSELQNSPHGAADHHDYGSLEYAELNGEQPEMSHYHAEVNNYQDLPVPVN